MAATYWNGASFGPPPPPAPPPADVVPADPDEWFVVAWVVAGTALVPVNLRGPFPDAAGAEWQLHLMNIEFPTGKGIELGILAGGNGGRGTVRAGDRRFAAIGLTMERVGVGPIAVFGLRQANTYTGWPRVPSFASATIGYDDPGSARAVLPRVPGIEWSMIECLPPEGDTCSIDW